MFMFRFINVNCLKLLFLCFIFVLLKFTVINALSEVEKLDLHPNHLPFYFYNNQDEAKKCKENAKCLYKQYLDKKACWGYESNCSDKNQYLTPVCPYDSLGWVQNKLDQVKEFFSEGDFGYIKSRKDEMKIICEPKSASGSYLACAKYTRYCQARNLWFDFKTLLDLKEPMRYREDVIRKDQVGGDCVLDKISLKNEGLHKSPLQSWYAELENFTELPEPVRKGKLCDIVIDKPTFIMKLDATVSMYHHFCDFFNLYVSQHFNNSFSKDVQIVIWDTLPYSSNFEVMWKVFTKNPVIGLDTFRAKKVCFKDVILPFLPRMIYGMYYNMPLIPGCEKSGLFHSFNRHVLHRLRIKQDHVTGGKLRITFLSRNTAYRKITNEDNIVKALSKVPDYVVKKVNYNRKIPFIEQLRMTHNTDIFIGMHGSGLTHLLFLPDWAVAFEIYHCDDENCYKDLARLRGVTYMTWENMDKLVPEDQGHHPTMGAHAKFTNYEFDVDETLRLIRKAAEKVRAHEEWKRIHEDYHNKIKIEL